MKKTIAAVALALGLTLAAASAQTTTATTASATTPMTTNPTPPHEVWVAIIVERKLGTDTTSPQYTREEAIITAWISQTKTANGWGANVTYDRTHFQWVQTSTQQ